MKRVYLRTPNEIRAASVALARYACDGERGRHVGDPVFELVTEGRQSRTDKAHKAGAQMVPYSACGDLCHWVLRCLGVRDERLVNRSDDGGQTPWQVGVNVSRISGSKLLTRGQLPEPGDIVWIGPDTPTGMHHVFICAACDGSTLVSYDYGQVDDVGRAAGAKKARAIQRVEDRYALGFRYLRGIIRIVDVPIKESAIVPDDFPLGELDDNPYPEPGVVVLRRRASRASPPAREGSGVFRLMGCPGRPLPASQARAAAAAISRARPRDAGPGLRILP